MEDFDKKIINPISLKKENLEMMARYLHCLSLTLKKGAADYNLSSTTMQAKFWRLKNHARKYNENIFKTGRKDEDGNELYFFPETLAQLRKFPAATGKWIAYINYLLNNQLYGVEIKYQTTLPAIKSCRDPIVAVISDAKVRIEKYTAHIDKYLNKINVALLGAQEEITNALKINEGK